MGLLHGRARIFFFFEAQRLKIGREIFDKMSGGGRGQSAALDGRGSGLIESEATETGVAGLDSGEALPNLDQVQTSKSDSWGFKMTGGFLPKWGICD